MSYTMVRIPNELIYTGLCTGLWQEKRKSDKPIGRAGRQGVEDAYPSPTGNQNKCCLEERDFNDTCSQTTNLPLHITKFKKKQQTNK